MLLQLNEANKPFEDNTQYLEEWENRYRDEVCWPTHCRTLKEGHSVTACQINNIQTVYSVYSRGNIQ